MTAAPDVALEFCRECLGLSDARLDGKVLGYGWKYELGYNEVSCVGFSEFRFHDLNAVLPVAQSWASSNGFTLKLIRCPDWDHWYAELGGAQASVRVTSPDLCRALMEVCVAAGRGMEGR